MHRVLVALGLSLAACQGGQPELSTTEQYTVIISPTSKDFGSLQVGQTSASADIQVNPSLGNQYDVINSITASCPDFVVTAPGLPAVVYRECEYIDTCEPGMICELAAAPPCTTTAYENYTFSAAFRPTVAGAVSCVVNISMNNGTYLRTMTLYGTGTVPPIDIDVQPAQVAFGDVRRNTESDDVTVTVRNAGGQTMTVSSVSISSPFNIRSGSQTSYTLPPGAQMLYSLSCKPDTVGVVNGNFVVNSNDPATPTVSVPLSCRGIDSNVSLSPSPTTIATTRVGEPRQATISIGNSGAASMALQSVTVTGTDITLMSAPAAGTYSTGTVGNAVVRFGAAAKGTQSGVLTVTYDNGQTRTSTISARALATSMALTPDGDVNFGPVCVGQSSTQTFTVIANEEGAFAVNQLGGITAPFTVTAPTLPATVQGSGGNTVTFSVRAAPTQPGEQEGSLELATDIPGASPRMINMFVAALPAGVSASPSTLDFGSTAPDTTTIGQSVHLSNCSTSPVAFSNARIEGPSASEFAIVQAPTATTIGAAANASWLVVLTTKSVGPKVAEFAVDHDGGTSRVALTGEGLGELTDPTDPIDPIDGEELSYYACSTSSHAAGLLPVFLGLAVVTLRRRRRR